MKRARLRAAAGGEPVDVTFERAVDATGESYVATVGERRLEVEVEADGGAGHLRVHGRVLPFRVVRRDGTVLVWLRGRTYAFEIVDRTAQRAADGPAASAGSALTAPMPGRVLKINAQAGDDFEAHAAIVVMESMKMEMAISVPRAGRVRELLCEEGELVEMGALLARLEPGDGDEASP